MARTWRTTLKVNIKTQPGDRDIKTLAIYVPLFWVEIPEALLKFVTLLHNIIWGQDLSTGLQKFVRTSKLVVVEALQDFEQETRERGTETNTNYELSMKDLIYYFFPPKSLQRQNMYLQRGLYKPCDTKIRYFIFRIDEMVEYLKKFRPFGAGKRLLEQKILEILEFSHVKEWQK